MSNPEKPISKIIDGLNLLSEPFAEHEISRAINSYIKEKNKKEIPPQWLAESMAFEFVHNYQDKETSWGTYYGPMMVWSNEDGTSTESPSIKLVTSEILDYWEERSRKAGNPILKLRYADLVWDFSKIITEKSPHFTIAHTIVDSTTVIATQNCHKYETDVIKKLERALFVALSINDSERIVKLRDTIIQYEDNISDDKKPGLWGFSFDLLLKNKKIPISNEIKQKIIQDLENRLTKLSDTTDKNNLEPWAAEAAALRLAEYYRSINQKDNIERVLLKFGTAFEVVSEDASALQVSSWLQRVHSVYLDYGMREEAERITIKLKEIGPKVNEEMKPISHEMKISHKEIQEYINSIIDNNLETTFARIAIHYIPKKDQVENQLKDLAKRAPISFLASRQIQDHQGRPIAFIGSLEDDMIGNIVHLTSQNMSMSAGFLRCVIEELVVRFKLTPEKIIDYFYQSPVFDEDKKAIIFDGIDAYLKNNHLAAIHLLIPQIEGAFRKLVENTGGSVLKPSRGGGMHLKTLDELLRDQKIINVFGEDTSLYFRILLTDQRGWNLRNDVCHGINPAATFQVNISDRVFHILLCLASVRYKETNN
ncbi:MAG: DUF4209 domain-containing protein [Candidatus Scalindua sp.]